MRRSSQLKRLEWPTEKPIVRHQPTLSPLGPSLYLSTVDLSKCIFDFNLLRVIYVLLYLRLFFFLQAGAKKFIKVAELLSVAAAAVQSIMSENRSIMSENRSNIVQARPIPRVAVPFIIDYDIMSPPPTPPEVLTPPSSSDDESDDDDQAKKDEGDGSAKQPRKFDDRKPDKDDNGDQGNPGGNGRFVVVW